MDRAQELSRHIRVAKQQPPIVMAALLNHLFSAQASHQCLCRQHKIWRDLVLECYSWPYIILAVIPGHFAAARRLC